MPVSKDQRGKRTYRRSFQDKGQPVGHDYYLKIEEQWPVLCNVLGVPELGTDPRYNTSLRQRDPEVRKYLMKRFEEIYATKTADEWCKLLTEADIVNDKLAHYKDMDTVSRHGKMNISMK